MRSILLVNRLKMMLYLSFVFSLLNASTPNAPYNLRSYDKHNPVGTGDKPYFGWYINDPDDNEIQSAYQVIVSSNLQNLTNDKGDVWDSGKVNSRSQNYIYLQGSKLQSSTRYYWKVRTWDKDGNVSPYSSVAFYETGLLSDQDWQGAKWIKRDSDNPEDYTYFRKKLSISGKPIQKATVYVSACHSYELFVNGTFIGKGFNHQYPQYSYYHAWDISKVLIKGSENVFAILTHWYGGGQGRAVGSRGLIMKAVIEYADSTTDVFGTDGSWKQYQSSQWFVGQPQRNGEGVGRVEKFDSRKTLPSWNLITFDDSSWKPAVEIGNHPVKPWTGTLIPDLTRVTEQEIKPASVVKLSDKKYVIDLGKINAGSFKISFNGGLDGDTVKMLGGFVLNEDGTVSTKLNQETNLRFEFIHNGSSSVFNPFVYFGMRYLQVDNSPCELTNGNVSFINRHYELDKELSGFNSSNSMLNDVWDIMTYSLIVGAQEGFVDTPTREKGAFLSDGWSQAVPSLSVMYDRIMNLRVLNEFLYSQDQFWPEGRLNAVYPNGDGKRDIPDYTQSFLVWVWDYYQQTGNLEFLHTNYERLKKIADYVRNYKNDTTRLIHNLEGGKGAYQYGIIDWPANMRYGYDMSAESRTVINAYAYADFDIMSRIAETTGHSEDMVIYHKNADEIKDAMNTLLINKEGVYSDGLTHLRVMSSHVSQHANILPLALGIVPEANKKKVADLVKDRKMQVGMVCLRWLPEAIGESNQGKHLVDLYTNISWDGWAKTISLGGTVTWESWNANVTNESMSHPWGAVGLLGIQKYILGIKPLKPQHEVIQVKPLDFENTLTFVNGRYCTDKGDIIVNWTKKDDSFTLTLTIPDNISAQVYIPKFGENSNTVIVDGKKIKGVEEGNYIFLSNIGSGVHTFIR